MVVKKNDLLNNTVHPDAFKCDTHQAVLTQKGFANGKFMQWDADQKYDTASWGWGGWKNIFWQLNWTNRKGVWKKITSREGANYYIDCEADINNAHGLAENDGMPYMTNNANAQPYTNNRNDAVPNTYKLWGWQDPLISPQGYWLCVGKLCAGSTQSILSGNYLNYDFATTNGETRVPRLYYMGQIISEMVALYPGLNVSLARFDGRYLPSISISFLPLGINLTRAEGGMVPIEMMPSEGNALHFENTIKSWDAWGHTTIEESYYEASLYMRGKEMKYGDITKTFDIRGLIPKYTDLKSSAGTRDGGTMSSNTYSSPVTESCQQNHIIVFASGTPEDDTDANSDIRTLIASETLPVGLSASCSGHGDCANELAHYLSSVDQFDDEKTGLLGTQTIKTHAISGFVDDDNADDFLRSISETHGQGTFHEGVSPEQIERAFRDIFDTITGSATSFTAPAVSVNAFNRLELGDELFYSVFKPKGNLSWDGNLKQYSMGEIADEFAIVDADGKQAIDQTTGFFDEDSRSIWTPPGVIDGKEVTLGGIASHLPNTRIMFTSPSSSTNGSPDDLRPLTAATASRTQLNILDQDSDYQNDLIAWAKDPTRKAIEDPLHSEPTTITYGKSQKIITDPDTGVKTVESTVDRTLFVGTNSGFLHAFNTSKTTPTEHFSFIPKELLHNLDLYYSGGGINALKAYGIDGPVTSWHQDINGDGQVNNGEKAYVYVTMRRGGQSFYALEVSDRSAPKLLWEAHGDYPDDFPNKPDVTLGYENLGQTWGRLEPATIDYNGSKKVVLFTSGGYDPIEDGSGSSAGPETRTTHTQGTTLYMIDALDGKVLWDAKKDYPTLAGQMTSSFPANAAPLDVTGDGLADLIYATDVGGRIWRFDFNTDASATSFKGGVKGAVVADLHSGSGVNNRRIYNEIDVIGNIGEEAIVLSVGTGNRSHPKAKNVTNYQYVIKDTVTRPSTKGTLTHSDLAEWPNASTHGWYVPLSTGEKVMARSNTVADQILFSTFTPRDPVPGSCDVRPGDGKVYKINLKNHSLKETSLVSGGIPPMPMLIPPKRRGKVTPPVCSTPGSCPTPPAEKGYSVLVGTEVVKFDDSIGSAYDNILRDYWLEKAQ